MSDCYMAQGVLHVAKSYIDVRPRIAAVLNEWLRGGRLAPLPFKHPSVFRFEVKR